MEKTCHYKLNPPWANSWNFERLTRLDHGEFCNLSITELVSPCAHHFWSLKVLQPGIAKIVERWYQNVLSINRFKMVQEFWSKLCRIKIAVLAKKTEIRVNHISSTHMSHWRKNKHVAFHATGCLTEILIIVVMSIINPIQMGSIVLYTVQPTQSGFFSTAHMVAFEYGNKYSQVKGPARVFEKKNHWK